MHYAVFLNRDSGALRGRDGGALTDEIRSALRTAGIRADIATVSGKHLAGRVADCLQEPARRPDAVVVGGGDGSVSGVARMLVGEDIALGVIPLGTFNLFARALQMPLDRVDAIQALARARPVAIDTMEVEGRTVLQHASIGLQPHVILLRERMPHGGRLGKMAHGLLAWTRVLRRLPVIDLKVETPQRHMHRRTAGVVISNDPLRRGWGETPVSDDLRQGRVAAYVTTSLRRRDMVRLSLAASAGTWRETGLVEEIVAPEIEVSCRKRRLLVSLDGELELLRPPLRFRSVPRSLTVLMPRED